jgi:hypothetical protein
LLAFGVHLCNSKASNSIFNIVTHKAPADRKSAKLAPLANFPQQIQLYPQYLRTMCMQRYRPFRILLLGAILICLAGSLYTQTPHVGQNLASLVYLDGRNILENAQFNLQRDQLLNLETFDLLPNSTVTFTTQNGAASTKKVYQTDANGAMKDILFFPKARSTIKCVLKFQTINGEEKRVVFHLKPV